MTEPAETTRFEDDDAARLARRAAMIGVIWNHPDAERIASQLSRLSRHGGKVQQVQFPNVDITPTGPLRSPLVPYLTPEHGRIVELSADAQAAMQENACRMGLGQPAEFENTPDPYLVVLEPRRGSTVNPADLFEQAGARYIHEVTEDEDDDLGGTTGWGFVVGSTLRQLALFMQTRPGVLTTAADAAAALSISLVQGAELFKGLARSGFVTAERDSAYKLSDRAVVSAQSLCELFDDVDVCDPLTKRIAAALGETDGWSVRAQRDFFSGVQILACERKGWCLVLIPDATVPGYRLTLGFNARGDYIGGVLGEKLRARSIAIRSASEVEADPFREWLAFAAGAIDSSRPDDLREPQEELETSAWCAGEQDHE